MCVHNPLCARISLCVCVRWPIEIIAVQCACYHGNTGFSVSLFLPPFHFPCTAEWGHVTTLTSKSRQAEERVSLWACNKPLSQTRSLWESVSHCSLCHSFSTHCPLCSSICFSLALIFCYFLALSFLICCLFFFHCCCNKLCLERKCWVMDCWTACTLLQSKVSFLCFLLVRLFSLTSEWMRRCVTVLLNL